MTTARLDAAALHRAARDPDSLTPDAFRAANTAAREAQIAYRNAVRDRYDLIRDARAVGVPWVALSRWTGISARTLQDIVNGA